MDNYVASAMVVGSNQYGLRIPDLCSIFTAEAQALLLSLEYIEKNNQLYSLICTDSKSCLQALEFLKTDHPFIIRILEKLEHLKNRDLNVVFCWIPGHVGLSSNEKADSAAKKALSEVVTKCQIPISDIKPVLNSYISYKWQIEWDKCPDNKLYKICQPVKKRLFFSFSSRHDQVVYTRCRIGHSRLTHSFLLTGGEFPFCHFCNEA